MSDQTQQGGASQKSGTISAPPRPPVERPGQADAPAGTDQTHTIVVLAYDRHGALDRIIGVLRRRRAKLQGFAIGRNEFQGMARITIVMNDSEVAVEQLVEQLRKIVDVQHVEKLTSEQTVARELALIKVNSNDSQYSTEIIELAHQFGAHVVDVTQQTLTLEVTGSEEKVEKFVDSLKSFGIREVARTGRVAMIRGVE
ncbi:MAG TPA: acetolactate synthase small subunit [Ktedonobacteraceae bacterium]|jgi:acetolactate synthase-1/3 small subunit|nr:acetolactate synthase small subunit [Ktedonobacteraceae bacterium]